MSELNGDVRKALELLEVARSEMVARLAASLAITRDAQLQKRLGEVAGISPNHEFMVGQIDGHSWLKVGGPGYTISRKPQAGLPAISLEEVLRSLPELERLLQDSMRKTHAMRDANDLLKPLFEPSPIQLRSNFRDIFNWAPLLEQMAYKAAMRALHVLDALRSAVRTELGRRARTANTGLLVYWQLIHALGQLTLVASSDEARPWLATMANSFTWESWTPSVVLLRERTFWLAAVAARSAGAFGDSVVEGYLRSLTQAKHPMMVFDGLFGLTAIALANPASKTSIMMELSGLRNANFTLAQNRSVYLVSYESAVRALAGPLVERREFRELHWLAGSAMGMATRPALIGDPTALSPSGEYLGFSMLPFVTDSSHDEHFPKFLAYFEREISRGKIAAVFRRAWGADPMSPTPRLLN
jgi:hypothetical protein